MAGEVGDRERCSKMFPGRIFEAFGAPFAAALAAGQGPRRGDDRYSARHPGADDRAPRSTRSARATRADPDRSASTPRAGTHSVAARKAPGVLVRQPATVRRADRDVQQALGRPARSPARLQGGRSHAGGQAAGHSSAMPTWLRRRDVVGVVTAAHTRAVLKTWPHRSAETLAEPGDR